MLSLQNQNGNILSTSVNGLQFVNGMEGARGFRTMNNSTVPLFEKDDDIMYIVQTDGFGNKNIKRYRCIEEDPPKMEDLFVSKESFNELKGEITDVKQSMAELLETIRSTNTAKYNGKNNKQRNNEQN